MIASAETVDPLDRAIGALLGLAVGDAVGTSLEFRAPGTFTPIDDMLGGGPFGLAAGEWTDDTSMALCLAESILDTGTMDLADQLRRYLLWKDDGYLSSNGRCFDIGISTRNQLERFRRSGDPVDPQPDDEAAANGSLMRLAAAPIRWHGDPAEAASRSGESSRTTHPAARPVDACRLMGAAIAALITGSTFDEVVAPTFWRWGDLHPEVARIATGSWRDKEPPSIRGTGYCVDALEAALWAVAGAEDFDSAVLRAANLGDDADTTAAIAGQIAGARWGAESIRLAWREKVVAGDRIVSLARGLFAAGGGTVDERLAVRSIPPRLVGASPGGSSPGSTPGIQMRRALVTRSMCWSTPGSEHLSTSRHPATDSTHTTGSLTPPPAARQLDLHHISFPIPDLGVVDDGAYDTVTKAINDGLRRGGVFVHCWGGIGRTGTVIGCVLADQGLEYDAIIERLALLRRGTRKEQRAAPEMPVQHDLIRRRTQTRVSRRT